MGTTTCDSSGDLTVRQWAGTISANGPAQIGCGSAHLRSNRRALSFLALSPLALAQPTDDQRWQVRLSEDPYPACEAIPLSP